LSFSGGDTIYAIIETGGKQYKVSAGETIDVERLEVNEGDAVEISRVLMIADGDNIITGKPVIDGAKVLAKCQSEGLGEKVRGLRFKAKTRAHTRLGHRQIYTRLSIDSIVKP